jgi:hypothetical protein
VSVAVQYGDSDARRVPSWALGAGDERFERDRGCPAVRALRDLVGGWVLGALDVGLAGGLERFAGDGMASRLLSVFGINISSAVETVILAPSVLLLQFGTRTRRYWRGGRHQRVIAVRRHGVARVARVVRGVRTGGACRA